ncbi:MAG: DUF2200 family protein [Flavobacteriales bacterium]
MDFETFFAKAQKMKLGMGPSPALICGYRVEDIEDLLMQNDPPSMLVDELAKAGKMEKIR